MIGNQLLTNMNQPNLWDCKSDNDWCCFKDARKFAHTLNLQSQDDWNSYANNEDPDLPAKPDNIPPDPDIQYRFQGWVSWEDWLGITGQDEVDNDISSGTSNLFDQPPENDPWLSFTDARQFARTLGFEYREEWEVYIKGLYSEREPLPEYIPSDPDIVYRYKGWLNCEDLLIIPESKVAYSEFREAIEFVRSCRLQDKREYRELVLNGLDKLPYYNIFLPEKPELEYKESGWIDWRNFLGNDIIYKGYEETRRFVHSLKLRSPAQWKSYCAGQISKLAPKPETVFAYPEIGYKDSGWVSWDDWLGISLRENAKKLTQNPIKNCRCGGRIKDCPECDGKGYIIV